MYPMGRENALAFYGVKEAGWRDTLAVGGILGSLGLGGQHLGQEVQLSANHGLQNARAHNKVVVHAQKQQFDNALNRLRANTEQHQQAFGTNWGKSDPSGYGDASMQRHYLKEHKKNSVPPGEIGGLGQHEMLNEYHDAADREYARQANILRGEATAMQRGDALQQKILQESHPETIAGADMTGRRIYPSTSNVDAAKINAKNWGTNKPRLFAIE